jgi:hypothetical protein
MIEEFAVGRHIERSQENGLVKMRRVKRSPEEHPLQPRKSLRETTSASRVEVRISAIGETPTSAD